MEVHGVDGVLVSLLGCMGWGKFSSYTGFEVGDGSKVKFWCDLWCGDMALKEVFPVLFGIACTKDASIAAHIELSRGSIHWNMSFARADHN
jgi:hypothetical protein